MNRLLFRIFILGLLAHATHAADPTRLNIVFLLADDLRQDALGSYGNGEVHTPHLDRLAARGARFTRATCSYPICAVSRTEMFAGRLMLAADLARGPAGGLKFSNAWTLYPAHFKQLGWRTIYTGKWHVSGTPWLDGFTETAGLYSAGGGPPGVRATVPKTVTGRTVTGYSGYTFKNDKNEPQLQYGVGLTPDTDRIMTDQALAAIERSAGSPFLLQVNFTAPHDPLHWPAGKENSHDFRRTSLPKNFRPAHPFETGNVKGRDELVLPPPREQDDVKKERAIYFAQVENVDAQVGRIVGALEKAGVLEQTLIVFTSDHGLALGSHGLMGKQNQYEHSINVPLILAGPGVPRQQTLTAQCYLRDLYPTLCDLTGVTTPASVLAKSLVPVLRDAQTEIYDEIYGYYTDTQRMVRQPDGWKLIHYPKIQRFQLFQVNEDPGEERDLIGDPVQQPRIARMKAALAAWQQQNNDPLLLPAPPKS
jgi:arylsulfatase A-like enzyme